MVPVDTTVLTVIKDIRLHVRMGSISIGTTFDGPAALPLGETTHVIVRLLGGTFSVWYNGDCSTPEISRDRGSLAIPTGRFSPVMRGTPWPMSLCRMGCAYRGTSAL